MTSVTGLTSIPADPFKILGDPLTRDPFSVESRVNEIGLEVLKIKDLYPELRDLTFEPIEYTSTPMFYAIHLQTLLNDLMGFTKEPEERDFGVALLLDRDGRFIEAPRFDSSDLFARIKSLTEIADEVIYLDCKSADLVFTASPQDIVQGFRQEAIKSQLFIEKCMQFRECLESHNALHTPLEGKISPVLIEWFESRISDIQRELYHIHDVFDSLYPARHDESLKYIAVFQCNIDRELQIILDFFEKVKENCLSVDCREEPAITSRHTRLSDRQKVSIILNRIDYSIRDVAKLR